MPVPFVRLIGWGLLLGGVAIFGLTAIMNYLQGDIWAVTEHGKIVNRWSAVIIDAVGIVVIGFAAGAAAAARKRAWAWGLTVIMLLSAVASINSMASFQATERMSASKSREAEIGRAKQADKLASDAAEKTLSFAGKARSSSARDDYLYANQEAVKAFRESKVQVQIAPDAGAELWASLSGWSLDRIQMFQAAYLAILLIILKMVCFQAAGFFLNPLAWLKAETVSPSSKGGSGGNGETLKTPEASKHKQPATVAARQAEIVPLRKAETPVASSPVKHPPTLSEYLARHDGATFTSQAALAKATGLSPATVSRQLQKLEGRGKVKRSKHKRGAHAVTYGRSAAPIYA